MKVISAGWGFVVAAALLLPFSARADDADPFAALTEGLPGAKTPESREKPDRPRRDALPSFLTRSPRNAETDADSVAPGDVMSTIQSSLVIVTTPNGVGSGFIARMDGRRYLVTNEHVVRGGKPSFRLLSGRDLSCGDMEISDSRDLVRYELFSAIPALPVSKGEVAMGAPISVFGNSDGAGVATSINGSVLGVGPEAIEVNAPFVQGNSGSPIINERGEVIGVATYALRISTPGDWLREGTRFNNVRRFGVRINSSTWKAITEAQYRNRADALNDLEAYCGDLYQLLYSDRCVNPSTGLLEYSFDRQKSKYRRFPSLCRLIADTVASLDTLLAKVNAMQRQSSAPDDGRMYSRTRTIRPVSTARQDDSWNRRVAKSYGEKFTQTYSRLYAEPAQMFRTGSWISERLKRESDHYLEAIRQMVETKQN